MTTHAASPRPVDRALSWVAYGVLVLVEAVVGLASVTSVFMTDSCGSGSDDPMVCSTGYFGSVLLGFWAVLVAVAVVVPVLVVVGTRRGTRTWSVALAGYVVVAVATVLFVVLMTR